MVTANDVIEAVGGKLSNTTPVLLDADQIYACDEANVKAVGKGFIRNYHHFTYPSPGTVACQYIKGEGPYVIHKMIQGAGTMFFCFCFFRYSFVWASVQGAHYFPSLHEKGGQRPRAFVAYYFVLFLLLLKHFSFS